MSRKRPGRTGNPDLRQQKPVPVPPIEQIEQEIFSLLSPSNFKTLKLHKTEDKKKFRDRILILPVMIAIVVLTPMSIALYPLPLLDGEEHHSVITASV